MTPAAFLSTRCRRYKRLEEGLTELQGLTTSHLHALRAQFSTARELTAKLAACSRSDAAHLARAAETLAAAGEADLADHERDSPETTSSTAAEALDDVEEDRDDMPGTALASMLPPVALDDPGQIEVQALHPRLILERDRLLQVADALTRQQHTHEAVGTASVQAAERLLAASTLAPIKRLLDALSRLRPVMDKRKRYQTDVAAYTRRVSRARRRPSHQPPSRPARRRRNPPPARPLLPARGSHAPALPSSVPALCAARDRPGRSGPGQGQAQN